MKSKLRGVARWCEENGVKVGDTIEIRWLELLRGAGQEVYEWRPRDWPAIEKVLARAA